jgi:hypothetical protein
MNFICPIMISLKKVLTIYILYDYDTVHKPDEAHNDR